jgi:hypothetical protein
MTAHLGGPETRTSSWTVTAVTFSSKTPEPGRCSPWSCRTDGAGVIGYWERPWRTDRASSYPAVFPDQRLYVNTAMSHHVSRNHTGCP